MSRKSSLSFECPAGHSKLRLLFLDKRFPFILSVVISLWLEVLGSGPGIENELGYKLSSSPSR